MPRHHGTTPRGEDVPLGTVRKPGRFGRMFGYLKPFQPAPEALDALAEAMVDNDPGSKVGNNQNIPAGYTYLGQFIDHDITLDLTGLSEKPADPEAIHNFRTPSLELDSVYGLGPDGSPFLYKRADDPNESPSEFLIGRTIKGTGNPNVPGGMPYDLPRTGEGFAIIGDPRNDENLLVAQTHLAFLKFHNAVVAHLRPSGLRGKDLFEAARREVRWHYQWIVLHDFVAKLVDFNILHRVLQEGPKHYDKGGDPYIPVEFSVAAYRLGHSMVRAEYNHNAVFRRGGATPASFKLLFAFSGLAGMITGKDTFEGGFPKTVSALPSDWIIDWRRFFDFKTKGTRPEEGFSLNFSRTIDPQLVDVLKDLPPGIGGGNLAARNMRRGWKMKLPSGQAVAGALGITPLTPDQIAAKGEDGRKARDLGFNRETPLWYYILKEAEIEADGQRLGQVGSTILSEVFVGLLMGDPESFLKVQPNWTPSLTREQDGRFTMMDLLRFAHAHEELLNPIGTPPPPQPQPQPQPAAAPVIVLEDATEPQET